MKKKYIVPKTELLYVPTEGYLLAETRIGVSEPGSSDKGTTIEERDLDDGEEIAAKRKFGWDFGPGE